MAAQKRAALIRRQHNALIPINQLPSELLSAILINSIDDRRAPNRIESLQILARVAWQWWQTIKSDPQFWTHITPPVEAVELQIRKAGILPLRLSWKEDELRSEDEDDTDWGAVGDLVQEHASRWTGIELERYNGDEVVLEALCTSHFPHLKYLRVHLSEYPETMSGDWRFNLAQCQNLQEVHLPIMPYLPVTPSSNPLIHLRTLHLALRSMDSCSSEDLESVLRLTPQLVELKLENLLDDTNPPASFGAPIIDLPNLRHLRFTDAVTGDERDRIPLLAQIRAPQLENLDLSYSSKPITGIDARVAFTALATWPSASTNRPEDAPLHSVLRNAGPSAAWEVMRWEEMAHFTVKGSGSGRLEIRVPYPLRDQLTEHIRTHIALFEPPLRKLRLGRSSVGSWSSEDLKSLLRLTPQLVELKVESLLDDTNPPAPFGAPIIDLPNLRCLEFTNVVTGDERDRIPLFAQIRAPQLEDFSIDGRVDTTLLATLLSPSTNQPEDAPLLSVLRNAGPSAAWKVDYHLHAITIEAQDSGPGRLHITLKKRHPSHDQLPQDILTRLAPFGLPVDLGLSFYEVEPMELEFWDEVLDATPSLRTITLGSSTEIARQVMDRLSTKAPSSSSASPRAPHLEKLDFRFEHYSARGSQRYDVEDEVKTMLDKRREIFVQGGVMDPPKLVVEGAKVS
ncbi:hypothetical protein FRC04_006591 [Tulasnella sp. 424]|nr:hypothetical protein FRC04_006591 [Tulasnella sp. 424]KAG8960895.1 hypothetical protein FRC05_006538 [Tulasnella sp. 425]